jgi:hypothetical protein
MKAIEASEVRRLEEWLMDNDVVDGIPTNFTLLDQVAGVVEQDRCQANAFEPINQRNTTTSRR